MRPSNEQRPGGHRGEAEQQAKAHYTPTKDTTPEPFRHPLQLARAIGCTKPGPERKQAVLRLLRAMRAALGGSA